MRAKLIDFVGRYLLGPYLMPIYSMLMIGAMAIGGVFLVSSDPGRAIFAFVDQPLAILLASVIVLLLQYEPIQSKLRDLWRSGLVAVPIALLALSGPALAQAAATPAPAASGFSEILTTVFATAITSIVGWIAFIFQKRTGMQVEASIRAIEMAHRDAIEKASGTAAAMVVQAVAKGVSKSTALSSAVDYLDDVVPEALKYFGLSNDTLRTKIDAKLAELFGIKPFEPAPAPTPAS